MGKGVMKARARKYQSDFHRSITVEHRKVWRKQSESTGRFSLSSSCEIFYKSWISTNLNQDSLFFGTFGNTGYYAVSCVLI